MAKVRFQMFLDERQKEALKKLQQENHIPIAEIIRRALDRFFEEYQQKKALPAPNAAVDRLLSVAGICRGGPPDLADRHDYYLDEDPLP